MSYVPGGPARAPGFAPGSPTLWSPRWVPTPGHRFQRPVRPVYGRPGTRTRTAPPVFRLSWAPLESNQILFLFREPLSPHKLGARMRGLVTPPSFTIPLSRARCCGAPSTIKNMWVARKSNPACPFKRRMCSRQHLRPAVPPVGVEPTQTRVKAECPTSWATEAERRSGGSVGNRTLLPRRATALQAAQTTRSCSLPGWREP